MDHNLFKPQNLEAGKHGVVGNCNGIPMDVRYREETPMFAKKISSLLKDLITGNYRILDYGCGVGRIAKEILLENRPDISIIGVDASAEMRKLAEENIPDDKKFMAVTPQEIYQSVGGEGYFDLAYLVYVLQHIPAIEIREALQRIHYHLKDNGILLYASSDYRMAIRFDGKGFFDDRFLGVNLQEELSRLFDLVGPAFSDEELANNSVVRKMVTGEGGGLAHPALIFKKKKITGPLFNTTLSNIIQHHTTLHGEKSVEVSSNCSKANKEYKNTFLDPIIPTKENPLKLILIQKQSPGDIMMATVALRDLHKTYPGEYITDMRTPCNEIFKNNPYVTSMPGGGDKEPEIIEALKANDKHPPIKYDAFVYCNLHYPMIHESGVLGPHFADGMPKFLADQLGRPIKRHGLRPELYLDQNEQNWPSPALVKGGYEGKYWVINAGSKSDFPLKQYPHYQEVVKILAKEIKFIQVGVATHNHPKLEGVINFIGKTNMRELMRLIYKAEGLLTCVSVPMHIAAAFKKPCVVIAGGREGTRWELYPDHRFLYTNGALECCRYDGCWKNKIEDCSHNENGIALCMKLIEPEEIARAIRMYYKGGVL